MKPDQTEKQPVMTTMRDGLMMISLNRPERLNAIDLSMIRTIQESLQKALISKACACVMLRGLGEAAFCAGGDVKVLADWVKQNEHRSADTFFAEEYALDLLIHHFPKPVIALCHGITMGGGLGIAAGADLIITTETTRMAMPETAIGFFPDVGATGWLSEKCRPGYPEFLGLTGYELSGREAVLCGLATHLVRSEKISIIINAVTKLSSNRGISVEALQSLVDPHCEKNMKKDGNMEQFIEKHFHGKPSLGIIFDLLKAHVSTHPAAKKTLDTLKKRSPTALQLTFLLLQLNRGRPLRDVFRLEKKAASYMIRHPDYIEGVRAQVLEKDHHPKWDPMHVGEVEDLRWIFE